MVKKSPIVLIALLACGGGEDPATSDTPDRPPPKPRVDEPPTGFSIDPVWTGFGDTSRLSLVLSGIDPAEGWRFGMRAAQIAAVWEGPDWCTGRDSPCETPDGMQPCTDVAECECEVALDVWNGEDCVTGDCHLFVTGDPVLHWESCTDDLAANPTETTLIASEESWGVTYYLAPSDEAWCVTWGYDPGFYVDRGCLLYWGR